MELEFKKVQTGVFEIFNKQNGDYVGEIFNGSMISGRGNNTYGLSLNKKKSVWVGTLANAKKLAIQAMKDK